MEVFCQHTGCDSPGAQPQFTKPLKQVRKRDSEPKYFCRKHRRKHPNVSPISGRPC